MNKEEILNKYINLIDKGYCSDCNELNCIDNFPHSKITHAIRELQQENQELKLELSGYRQAILEYKDMLGFKEENTELKKQLEENTETLLGRILELRGQQKEFIKWLENYLELLDYNNIEEQIIYDTIEEILQKYKEIIGGKE